MLKFAEEGKKKKKKKKPTCVWKGYILTNKMHKIKWILLEYFENVAYIVISDTHPRLKVYLCKNGWLKTHNVSSQGQ